MSRSQSDKICGGLFLGAETRSIPHLRVRTCKIIVIVNSIMVYCKADAAYVRVSSDKLRKMEEEVIIVEYKNELYEYLLKSSMKRSILSGKR